MLRLLSLCCLALLTACGSPTIVTSCEPTGAVTPICGIQMPEDLEPLPDGGGVLIAEFGAFGITGGAFSWIDPQRPDSYTRFLDSSDLPFADAGSPWGDEGCKQPTALSPHGIHLSQRGNSQQLLVVNHAEDEQVLFFELTQERPDRAPELKWRGCVTFPEYAVLNDVAALPDGGFAVTHMYERGHEAVATVGSFLGLNNGHVWRWQPNAGLSVLPGTEARMPNGIEVDPSGQSIWINNYIAGELTEYNLESASTTARIAVPNIDNSAWLEDGRLLLASHALSPADYAACAGLTEGSCGAYYALIAVDTNTLETETLYQHDGGGTFGPATVAVPYGDLLVLGSFSGDRLGLLRRGNPAPEL
ncbi:MAG: hypothetical protein AAGA91_06165 [Pseudomonadota bacterium]